MSVVPQVHLSNKPGSSLSAELVGTSPQVSPAPVRLSTFIVKLRNSRTRSWGNETEVIAASAREAAEQLAGGERLLGAPGERANLRARVWKTPYGSFPDLWFYADMVAHPA